jgi:hypothetical protein
MKPADNAQLEIHLPDESRHYVLEMEHLRCTCGCCPWLMRRKVGHNRWQFRVKCGYEWDEMARGENGGIIVRHFCANIEPTPWLNNSQDAIQHWRLAKTLGAL